jgi:hypothetical protein
VKSPKAIVKSLNDNDLPLFEDKGKETAKHLIFYQIISNDEI